MRITRAESIRNPMIFLELKRFISTLLWDYFIRIYISPNLHVIYVSGIPHVNIFREVQSVRKAISGSNAGVPGNQSRMKGKRRQKKEAGVITPASTSESSKDSRLPGTT
jgi:hypothetical protein